MKASNSLAKSSSESIESSGISSQQLLYDIVLIRLLGKWVMVNDVKEDCPSEMRNRVIYFVRASSM